MYNGCNWFVKCVWFCWLVVPAQVLAATAGIDEEEVARRVVADWKARQNCARVICYEVSGRIMVRRGAKNVLAAAASEQRGGGDVAGDEAQGDHPPEDTSFSSKRRYVLDFVNGRIRRECQQKHWSVELRKFVPTRDIRVYDGTSVTIYHPKEDNPGGLYSVPENTPEYSLGGNRLLFTLLGEVHDVPITLGHGLVKSPPVGLRQEINPTELDVYRTPAPGEGRREAVIRLGKPAVYFHEFRVDLERQSAVRGLRSFRGRELVQEIEIEYQQTGAGWLPSAWRSAVYVFGQLAEVGEFKVERIQINPDWDVDKELTLKPPPGATLRDEQGKHFRVAADGSRIPYDPTVPPPGGIPWIPFVIAGLGLLLAGILTVLARRVTRKKAS
ncbi:MAG TPA: hypothetical protein EYH34_18585 [Planctomycetes bacterium]|nr:hypothetical protein [Planctomycetota bacterium]